MKKLRNYKGVTYSCGFWYDGVGDRFSKAASVIANSRDRLFSDDDHAELMRLKADPYEPTPTLEEVVLEWLKKEIECRPAGSFPKIDLGGLIDRIR
jgi:hypothetical protein